MQQTTPGQVTSVAVFAHNEEETIRENLESVLKAGLGHNDPVYVMINGSTDKTATLVAHLAQRDARIHPVIIALGDKANAWSYYVNRLAPANAGLHVFVDGDVKISKGSLDAIKEQLATHPEALAASTLPQGGRTSKDWSERILRHHGLAGNFYALRDSTLREFQTQSVSMPVGLVGDDQFLRWILLRGLNPVADPVADRIQPVEHAFFHYTSIPVYSWAGLRALFARQMRYQLRDLQTNLLVGHLMSCGLSAMPRRIETLYNSATPLMALKGQIKLRKLAFLYTYMRVRTYRPDPDQATPWYETQTGSNAVGQL
ncbi:MAG: glycosyltransferase [Pseudomonadota bacterium]